jgi:hypothetical protein
LTVISEIPKRWAICSFANFRDDSIHGLGIAEDGGRFDRYGFHMRLDFRSRTLEGT